MKYTKPTGDILDALATYHYLTAEQVRRLLYCDGCLRHAQRHLLELIRDGRLNRRRPSLNPDGPSPYVYSLSDKAKRDFGLTAKRNAKKGSHIEHVLGVNDILIGARKLADGDHLVLGQSMSDIDFGPDPLMIGKEKLIPDGFLDFYLGELERLTVFLEYDRATMTDSADWKRKINLYARFYYAGYKERFGDRYDEAPTIATVISADSLAAAETRRRLLLQWTEQELGRLGETRISNLFIFSTVATDAPRHREDARRRGHLRRRPQERRTLPQPRPRRHPALLLADDDLRLVDRATGAHRALEVGNYMTIR